MADWQKIGGIAGVVAIPVSILIAAVQCSTGSDTTSPPRSSVPTSVATSDPAPQSTVQQSSPAPVSAAPAEHEPPIHSSDTLSMGGSSAWGVSIFSFNSFWVRNPAGQGVTITVDPSFGISAGDGAGFASVATPSYPACAAANYNIVSREWKDLPTGSTLCIKTGDTRVGRVQFIWKKGKEDPATDVRVVGVIWEPTHD
ncbi:hypothetical protein NONO_c34240 [Nocardia nova SH22a]|uniref:Uncharacterized protein n=1 Tax=Nocardia nova SH22a TaxID=1415166 RepID=W5TLU3_9NOCA|nr:hypothetical protein [Nocardia nova]AHH18211.1 hypothetical protein NONO_c34240 [Nocardia nova SH22a]